MCSSNFEMSLIMLLCKLDIILRSNKASQESLVNAREKEEKCLELF